METPELTAEQLDYLVLSSDKLATKYPELNARIQRAVGIVRAGGVQLSGDNAAAVANGSEAPYEVRDEGCGCEDFTRGNAPHGRCKHRLAVLLLTRTLEHFNSNGNPAPPASEPASSEPAAPVKDLEAAPVRKQQPPYVCPEARYWVKGSRRAVNKAEKEAIDSLHQEAEAKCRAAYEALPAEVWGCIVLLPRNQKVTGKDDVFVSLRNPYLNVAGRLMLLRSKRQPKDICSEFFVLGDRTLCKATVKVGQCSATGTAEVIEGPSGPTATNPYEVAETSAVGRALGNLGIGLVGGIASAEEVMNARARQPESTPAGMEQAA